MDSEALKNSLTDAIKYWELRRVVYNAVLAAIVITYFWIGLPASKQNLSSDFVLGLFLLAVVANVAYCAAYLPDIFAQMSDFRDAWRRMRWIVFLVGTLFASYYYAVHRNGNVREGMSDLRHW